MTDFPFPPKELGTWRTLSRAQREEWITAACNRHFKWLRRRGGWKDAEPGTVFSIDGAAISDFTAFMCALGEAVNGPGGYFGNTNILSLQDCLYGAFGVKLPFVIRIANRDSCRASLNGLALAEWASERVAKADFLDEEHEQWLLDAARRGRLQAQNLFDFVVETLQSHGVVVEAEP